MNHTKEPWHAIQNPEWENADYRISNKDNDKWANFNQIAYANEANAKRIVACVNACAGITNEALEAGIVKEAMELFWRVSDKAVLNENNQMTYNGKTIFISDMEGV